MNNIGRRRIIGKVLGTAGEGGMKETQSEISQLLSQDADTESVAETESSLETAVEEGNLELFQKSITSGDTDRSLLTTESLSVYRRSVSPDTMLQGTSSISSRSVI